MSSNCERSHCFVQPRGWSPGAHGSNSQNTGLGAAYAASEYAGSTWLVDHPSLPAVAPILSLPDSDAHVSSRETRCPRRGRSRPGGLRDLPSGVSGIGVPFGELVYVLGDEAGGLSAGASRNGDRGSSILVHLAPLGRLVRWLSYRSIVR